MNLAHPSKGKEAVALDVHHALEHQAASKGKLQFLMVIEVLTHLRVLATGFRNICFTGCYLTTERTNVPSTCNRSKGVHRI